MTVDLEKLNPEQKQAVVHQIGPLLIVAGAGTGKTRVITDRIAYLIEQKLASFDEILALTFTEKAALEMEERVDREMEYGYSEIWISTFHGFAEKILKDNGLDIGLPNFKVLDGTGAWLLMRQNLEKLNLKYYKPLGNPNKFIKALIDHFSKCKDQMIYPKDYLDYADTLKTNLTDIFDNSEEVRVGEVAQAYQTYQQMLLENNYLDFGDLINYCLQLFQKRPAILEKYRAKFKYILVDEFQDTNKAQYELIKLLASPKNNLTVTADDDQAIYKWRGASVENILKFKTDFPKAKEVCLVKNYRSGQEILDLSYNFIQANNPNRLEFISKINKKLQAKIQNKSFVKYLHFKSLNDEAKGVANNIVELLEKDKTLRFSDFAILVRANDSAVPFASVLEKLGLPYQFLASRGLFQKPVILNAIAYLKLLDNYHESLALYRVLVLPFLGMNIDDVMLITRESHKSSQSVYETLNKASLLKGITQESLNKITFLLSLINKHTEMAKTKTSSEVFVAFLNDSGFLKYLVGNDKLLKIDLLVQFYKKIKSFEDAVIDPCLKNFLSQIEMEIESGDQGKMEFDVEQGPDTIKIMTVHSAKGLEFKYVFVVSLVDKRFPSISRKDAIEIPQELAKEKAPEGDIHLQEERRLFYVAMTRAKQGLFLTSALNYGGKTSKKPSIFLTELGVVEKLPNKANSLESQNLEKEHHEPPELNIDKWPIPNHFSYTQLAAFNKCPYQYKLAHILKIPIKGKASFSFGKTLHNTLNNFLTLHFTQKDKNQETLFGFESSGSPSTATFEDLVEIYEKNWLGEWYESKAQKNEYKKLGKEILKSFYDKFIKNPPKILKINDKLALELSFHLKIGEYTLIGKIDYIEETPQGIKIVDFKTGKTKEKLEKNDKTQLLLYQIACEEFLKLKPVELAYYYLESGQEVSFLGKEQDKQKLKDEVIQTIKKIYASNFKATPGFNCQFCDFKSICHFVSGNED